MKFKTIDTITIEFLEAHFETHDLLKDSKFKACKSAAEHLYNKNVISKSKKK